MATTAIEINAEAVAVDCCQRKVQELTNVIDSHLLRFRRSAQGHLGNAADAEDAVQDAMLAAFTHLDEFQRRADFLTWATRIVINAALMQIRKARAKPVTCWGQVNGEIEESFSIKFMEDRKPTPEEIYQQAEQKRLFVEALQQLPADYCRSRPWRGCAA